jgi:type III restriction enzyme
MEQLRRGEVMIANWHRLAKQETDSAGGTSAKVVKTGEPVEVVINPGHQRRSWPVRKTTAACNGWTNASRRAEMCAASSLCPCWPRAGTPIR